LGCPGPRRDGGGGIGMQSTNLTKMTRSDSCGIIAVASVSGWFGNLYGTAVAAFRSSLDAAYDL
jgi:hypothetical protein